MKNGERIVYIVTIVILLIIIAGGATYIVMMNKSHDDIVDKDDDKDIDDNRDSNVSLDDQIKFLKTNVIGNRIVQEYEIKLNGKTNKLKVDYLYSTDDDIEIVEGRFNDNVLYLDEENMYDEDGELDINKDEMFSSKNLREEFNKDNFRIIKGEDNKSYLLIMTEEDVLSHLLILNDDLEIINKSFNNYGVEAQEDDNKYGMIILGYNNWKIENSNKWVKYDDQFDLCDNDDMCYPHLKIEDNKIYYLYPVLKSDFEEGDYGYLEERVYTIKDNEIHYEIIDKNKIIDASGQLP